MKPWLAVAVLGGLVGCRHASSGAELAGELARNPGSYASGTITGVVPRPALNRRDFVYDLELDPTGHFAAFTHLAARVFRLGIADLAQPALLADAPVNTNALDVQAVAFSPDGQRIAVGSADHRVRLFDLHGQLLAEVLTEEPLTAIAFSADGAAVVAGSESGLLTVFRAGDLDYQSELSAHRDAVSALAVDGHGVLWSGGLDRRVHAYSVASVTAPVTEVRLHAGKAGAVTTLVASAPEVDGGAELTLAVDERSELSAITPEAAARLGIDVGLLADHMEEDTPSGRVQVAVSRDHTLRFKSLVVPHVDFAICASCVFPGVDGVLGRAFVARHPVVLDASSGQIVLHGGADSDATPRTALTLHVERSFTLAGVVADLTVSRDGSRLGVALDEAKPERTLALYQREKAGDIEPVVPGNVAAIVDARTGAVLEKHNHHAGVVSSAAISPDGRSLASGGWDDRVLVYSGGDTPVAEVKYGWCVRRVRFSPNGELLGVAAWTPQNARDADSDPAAQLLDLSYVDAQVAGAALAPR